MSGMLLSVDRSDDLFLGVCWKSRIIRNGIPFGTIFEKLGSSITPSTYGISVVSKIRSRIELIIRLKDITRYVWIIVRKVSFC
jgi:hypothetical protein